MSENKYLVGAKGASELTAMTAAELAEKIHSREVSSVEVTQAHLDRIADVDGDIHAFLHVGAEEALDAARAVDESLAAGLSVSWRAVGAERRVHHHGCAHNLRFEDARRLHGTLRCHRDASHSRGRYPDFG